MEGLKVILPALWDFSIKRKTPASEHTYFWVCSTDDVELSCTLLGHDPDTVVVVAHPAVVGGYYHQVVSLAEELAKSFSVIIFDFRGHGRSSGRCPLGFGKVSEDLEAVVERTRLMGFEKVGVAGFSMGAAAAMLFCARGGDVDSLVSIGCPPRIPDVPFYENHPKLVRGALRLLGMRVDPRSDGGPVPCDVASDLPRIPKLLVFGEWEVVPSDEIDTFVREVTEPKQLLTVSGAWHADLLGNEVLVREWLECALA